MAASAKANLNYLSLLYLNDKKLPPSEERGVSEFEVRFGTRGIRNIGQIEYDQVISRLRSLGFDAGASQDILRIMPEYNETFVNFGKVRAEILGKSSISTYCKTEKIVTEDGAHNGRFELKYPFQDGENSIRPVNFDAFNFRASLQYEKSLNPTDDLVKDSVRIWGKTKKTYRYINRVALRHETYPVRVDVSVVKNSKKYKNKYIPTYNFLDSRVLQQPNQYEIEIEIDPDKVGEGTEYADAETLTAAVRKVITFVLQGLQGTNYPVSYLEQQDIIKAYSALISENKKPYSRRIYPKDFVGPSSNTLQMKNIVSLTDGSTIPNIRKNYTVTDKADGVRKMLYISSKKKVYLIDTNMNVQYTGTKVSTDTFNNTLLDGEHILHNKSGKYINLYAAFDIYFLSNKDIRQLPFLPIEKRDKEKKEIKKIEGRLPLLNKTIQALKLEGVSKNDIIMRIQAKSFYSTSAEQTIFQACNTVLQKEKSKLFEYNTDGLIFTPTLLGVGANHATDKPKSRKVTWDYSFKWKPPEHNTIDFLVTITRDDTGAPSIGNMFQSGKDMSAVSQLVQYKTAILRVGYDQKRHGYLNPCQQVINGSDKVSSADEEYRPVQFFPSNPYDAEAGICRLLLTETSNGNKIMVTENNEIIDDNMIVEFRYDFTKDIKWRWVPIRVRYDKTAELRNGGKNFGNAYHVANSNWHSLHNPITDIMLQTSKNIPTELDDNEVYYNRTNNTDLTRALRNFHNMYIKKKLISSVSKPGDTLIDMAVGKGGDLPKWIAAKLSFILGIDISQDNIMNRIDGVCARYLNYKKQSSVIPKALFVEGNSSRNIRDGNGIFAESSKELVKALFGSGAKDKKKLGEVPYSMYGKLENGFNICSIQFALHYMWESPETLHGFLRNVAETTTVGGHFIGTSYDGELIFKKLSLKKENEGLSIMHEGTKVWSIIKKYDKNVYYANSSCIGYGIDVYQESINKTFREYLVHPEYLTRLMENYGFVLLDKSDAATIGLPSSSGNFSELFANMNEHIKKNPASKNNYGSAPNMAGYERDISFLNRYFVYKKVRNVNAENVSKQLLGQTIDEELTERQETNRAREAVIQTLDTRASSPPSTKKLKKKLKLKLKKKAEPS